MMHLHRAPEKGDMIILSCGDVPSSHMVKKVKGEPLRRIRYFPKCSCGNNEILLIDQHVQDIIYKEML